MKPIYLQEILPHIGGTIIQGETNPTFTNVTTRIKNLKEHTLFFFVKKKVKFLNEEILPFPPSIVIIDNLEYLQKISGEATIVKVNRGKQAFRKFLSYYRSLFNIPVIGITGSSGKSTTKKMITHILSNQYSVKSTIQNYNLFSSNAAVLMRFNKKTDFGVFELGVGYRGHLSRCSKYMGPFTAVITTIGTDHVSRYRSKADYINEKTKILRGIGKDNAVILNADCENTQKIDLSHIYNKIFFFGLSDTADYRAANIRYSSNGMEFTLHHEELMYDVFVPGYGIHNVYNALAAIATIHFHGISIEKAIERLTTFKHMKRHLEVSYGINGSTIIDDTWNTNSKSVEAALTVLNAISAEKKTIAILGKISELGLEEESEHRKIGQMVLNNQIEKLITIGETASIIANEAISLGMKKDNVFICENADDVLTIIDELADPQAIILVKTSMRESFKEFIKKLKEA